MEAASAYMPAAQPAADLGVEDAIAPGADPLPDADPLPGAGQPQGADLLPGADRIPGADRFPGADPLPGNDRLPGKPLSSTPTFSPPLPTCIARFSLA